MAEIDITLKLEVQQLQAKLNQVQNKLKDVGDKAEESKKKMGDMGSFIGGKGTELFKKLGGAIAGAFAVDAVMEFGKACVAEFMEAEKNASKLQFAVDKIAGQGGSFDKLLQQSKDLQSTSIFADDDIMNAQTMALQFGMNADQVERLLPLITDMATATGMDLGQAMETVIRGVEGQTRGLKPLGLAFKDTGDKTKNLSIIMQGMEKFTGSAASSLETAAGKAATLTHTFDDTKEAIGQVILNAFGPLLKTTKSYLETLNGIEEAPSIADNIERERNELNVLVKSIMSANVGSRERNNLIEELRLQYPDFYGKIKNEVNSNISLQQALSDVNKEYLKKIKMEVAKEDLLAIEKEGAKIYKEQAGAIKNINSEFETLLTKEEANAKLTGNDKNLKYLQSLVTWQDRMKYLQERYANDKSPMKQWKNYEILGTTIENAGKKLDELDKQQKKILEDNKGADSKDQKSTLGFTTGFEDKAQQDRLKAEEEYAKTFEELVKRDTAHLSSVLEIEATKLKDKEYTPADADQLMQDWAVYSELMNQIYQEKLLNAELTGEDTQAIKDDFAKQDLELEKWLNTQLKALYKEDTSNYEQALNDQVKATEEVVNNKVKAFEGMDFMLMGGKSGIQDQTQALIDETTAFYDELISEANGNAELIKQIEQEKQDTISAINKSAADKEKALLDWRKEQFNTYVGQIKESLGTLLSLNVEAATKKVEQYDSEISKQEEALQAQKDLEAQGYSNSVGVEQKKLDALKKQREEALNEQKKAMRLQLAFESAAQAAGIATAIVNIFKHSSVLGLVGIIAGAAQVASLFALITQFKAKAQQISKMEKGGLIKGPLHSAGGIPILGTGIEVEGGEYVMNRASTQRYLPLLEVLNREGMNAGWGRMNHTVSLEESRTMQRMATNIERMANGTTIIQGNGYYIEKTGNKTRKVYTS